MWKWIAGKVYGELTNIISSVIDCKVKQYLIDSGFEFKLEITELEPRTLMANDTLCGTEESPTYKEVIYYPSIENRMEIIESTIKEKECQKNKQKNS